MTRAAHNARTLDLSYNGQGAAFSPNVRLTASEALWLARAERDDDSIADVLAHLTDTVAPSSFGEVRAQGTTAAFTVDYAPGSLREERQVRRSLTLTGTTTVDGGMQELGNVTVWDTVTGEGWTNLYGRASALATYRARQQAGAATAAKRTYRLKCECGECKTCKARARKAASRAAKLDRQADLANAAADARTANVPVATASERWG